MTQPDLNLKVILGGNPTEKKIKGVPTIYGSNLIRVIAFIGIIQDKDGAIKRGIGVNYPGGMLFFQATESKNPLHYWHTLQILERLWCLDEQILKETIVAGEHYHGTFTLPEKYGDTIKQQFDTSRTEALKQRLPSMERRVIEENFLNPRAVLPENLNFSNYQERGGIFTHHMPVKEIMYQTAPVS